MRSRRRKAPNLPQSVASVLAQRSAITDPVRSVSYPQPSIYATPMKQKPAHEGGGMRFIVLDNGLRGRGEHSYHLIREICGALSRRGIECRVFGARRMERVVATDIGATRHFTGGLYKGRFPPFHKFVPKIWSLLRDFIAGRSLYSEERTGRVLNKIYQRDLGSLPADVWNRENLIFIPAISQNQILGLIRHLLSLSPESLPTVVCQLMFTPDWTPWGARAQLGETYYREAFKLAGELLNKSLFFTTENDEIAGLYRREFKIHTSPGVTGWLPASEGGYQELPSSAKNVRLGFFGYSKTEKGFHLLPEAIEICRKRKLSVEFVIQIQHSNWERETNEAERRLRRMGGIEFIEGTMNSTEFMEKTNAVHVTLLPYDPQRFGPRGSGLFIEAVAGGRPIIAARGIYAATSIERGDAEGEIFAPYTSAALAAAIERLLSRLAECQARAAARAEKFASRYSGDVYADMLLSFLKRRPVSGSPAADRTAAK